MIVKRSEDGPLYISRLDRVVHNAMSKAASLKHEMSRLRLFEHCPVELVSSQSRSFRLSQPQFVVGHCLIFDL